MGCDVFFLFIFSCLMGYGGAVFVWRYGGSFGLVDCPNKRSSHVCPTPKGGAIGILVGFVLSAVHLNLPSWLWIPSSFLSIVSLVGDRYEIAPKVRLIIQFSCALYFLAFLFWSSAISPFWYLYVIPLSIFVVGTANFYNFMDGVNGIAGISGVVSFSLLGYFGIIGQSDPAYIVISFSIACACLGFLPCNIPTAKVFMGDVGSVLLGFLFAGFVVVFSRDFTEFVCAVGFLFPFYADELSTMVLRLKNRESLSVPHRRHLYQIFANELEVDHWKVSVCYGGTQLVVGIVMITLRDSLPSALAFLVLTFVVFFAVSIAIRYSVAQKKSRT